MLRLRNIVCILFFFTTSLVKSQNLVPNPSFEHYNSLPCDFIYTGTEFSSRMHSWTMPTAGTTDILSTMIASNCNVYCYSTNFLSRGSQTPRTGTTMCGIHTYGSPMGASYREYLQVQLTSPLEVGKTYYVEFHVSTGDNNQYACNNIGAHFSVERINAPSSNTILSYAPQIKTSTIINDTNSWVKISGHYKATEASQYLTIGNFDADINTSVIEINESILLGGYTYYFIDDVLVDDHCSTIDTTITICAGSTTMLSIPEVEIVNWSLASDPTNSISTDPTITITTLESTAYIAFNDCDLPSTFQVQVENPLSYRLPNDTSLCITQQITFDATTPGATYLWNNGSQNSVLTANTAGLYSLTITNSCGSISDEIYINVNNPIIPNLITPNGDGMNDTFDIDCLGDGSNELYIYNEWNTLVYHSKAYTNTWNGSSVSGGIYYYQINSKTETLHKGWIQVLK